MSKKSDDPPEHDPHLDGPPAAYYTLMTDDHRAAYLDQHRGERVNWHL